MAIRRLCRLPYRGIYCTQAPALAKLLVPSGGPKFRWAEALIPELGHPLFPLIVVSLCVANEGRGRNDFDNKIVQHCDRPWQGPQHIHEKHHPNGIGVVPNFVRKGVVDNEMQPSGDPNGIRTRVTAVKGRCPRPLDDRVTKASQYRNSTPSAQDKTPRRKRCSLPQDRQSTLPSARSLRYACPKLFAHSQQPVRAIPDRPTVRPSHAAIPSPN